MSEFRFGPASEIERVVFGAQRAGYPSRSVGIEEVYDWISFMRKQGIQRICCLLPQEQLDYYEIDLLEVYSQEFGEDNVCWAPIKDFYLSDESTLKEKILPFLSESDTKREPVLVHCSGGSGLTGHVLAAWLVYGRGLASQQALSTVKDMGRSPCEAVELGNTTEDELFELLDRCSK